MCVGVLFIRPLVISFIYIREVIVTKAFLAKGTTNFSFGLRTITAVSGTCWDFIPFRVADKILFSNILTLGHAEIDDHFSSIEVGPFCTEDVNLAKVGI